MFKNLFLGEVPVIKYQHQINISCWVRVEVWKCGHQTSQIPSQRGPNSAHLSFIGGAIRTDESVPGKLK